jgi:hypothetical protein
MWDWLIDKLCRLLCRIFWWRFRVIPQARNPDVPLLRQLLLWKSGKLEVYLQHFDNPEEDFWFHCHEWPRMRSFVLSDGFIEERAFVGEVGHGRFTTYKMDEKVWHRTALWGRRCWTLFICLGGRTVQRGYREKHADSGGAYLGFFIPWREHIVKQVPSLTGITTP